MTDTNKTKLVIIKANNIACCLRFEGGSLFRVEGEGDADTDTDAGADVEADADADGDVEVKAEVEPTYVEVASGELTGNDPA